MTTLYNLAKQMKDLGFPQNENGRYGVFHTSEDGTVEDGWTTTKGNPDGFYLPTLEEVIKACGEEFFQLTKGSGIWYAEGDIIGTDKVTGSTPLIACMKLWIALNQKTI